MTSPEKLAVVGLGYVGLPLLVSLDRHFESVTGFDIDPVRIAALRKSHDWTGEVTKTDLSGMRVKLTDKAEELKGCTFFIVTVPTPIDHARRPDLRPILGACRVIGEVLKKNGGKKSATPPLIVFESTVYPGLTETICGPAISSASGLRQGADFKLGYSPERINPGDEVHRLENIVKVVSAEDEQSVERLEAVYGAFVKAGIHRAPNIRVAEAAKVIENTQRDLNIALMNEVSIICDRLDIRTRDVLAAAGTKWNFLKFSPGLVGGHCIGVDPYYLTARAEELGYHPQVILAGRRINDGMPVFVAQKILKMFAEKGRLRPGARVGVLGLTFKENVRDLRNSRVPEIVHELRSFGIDVLVHDPIADPEQAVHEYGLDLCGRDSLQKLDAVVLAVPHRALLDDLPGIFSMVAPEGCLIDVKSAIDPGTLPKGLQYWSL